MPHGGGLIVELCLSSDNLIACCLGPILSAKLQYYPQDPVNHQLIDSLKFWFKDFWTRVQFYLINQVLTSL